MSDAKKLISTIETLQSRYMDGGLSRRGFLQSLFAVGLSATAVSMIMSSSARAQADEAVEILWDGKPFDAGGESVTICHWGGEMQDMAYEGIIKQFEADYNCRVVYDAAYPWFPKMSTAGPDNPPIDLYGGNLPESLNLEAQGYFVSHADLKANVPAVNDMVEEIAFYGPGVIWGLHVMGLAYRTDTVVPPPTSLADLFDKKYENTRAIYVPINDLQAILFMSIAQTFGADQYDKQAALDKLQEGMPWITSPFTGETMNLMERGEVVLAWQTDGEALLQKERGLPINWVQAKEVAPFNVMHKAVSKGSSPMKKKLAYALLDRYCSPEAGTMWSEALYFHPVNPKAVMAPKMADLGYTGTSSDLTSLYRPDWKWYIENQQEIIDATNTILAG
jgi:putative spermidine/putrescine transport system substrate-binding protein